MHRRTFLSAGAASLLTVGTVDVARAGQTATPALLPSALSLVPAQPAESLCESYMVNTKIFYGNGIYRHTDAVVSLLRELGVRTVRERITTGTSTGTRAQQSAMLRLSGYGTKWHGTVADIDDWRDAGPVTKRVMDHLVNYYAPRLGGDLTRMLRSFGGVNEADNPSHGPDWAMHARIMQNALWQQATSRRQTASVPVAGPSTRSDYTPERARQLGDLTSVTDWGALHYYNKGTSPTRGISERISVSRRNFPTATRWVVCETGYNDSPQTNKNVTIPEWASATYSIRGICDFFKRGAIYGRFELLDDPDVIDRTNQTTINRTADIQAHFGLVAMTRTTTSAATPDTWRKKPEFYATQRFLRLLSDRGPGFATRPLSMQVSGGGADLQRLLLQKRDGRYYLVLWRDVEIARPFPSGAAVRVTPVNVTVQFSPARPVAVYAPGRSSTPVLTRPSTDRVTVSLGGDLLVVKIG